MAAVSVAVHRGRRSAFQPGPVVDCSQCGTCHSTGYECGCLICGTWHVAGIPCGVGAVAPNVQPARVMQRAPRSDAGMPRSLNVAFQHHQSTQPPHYLGDLHAECHFCGARFWSTETINCCSRGSISISGHDDVPVELQRLLHLPHVRDHIRAYNMAMCMASVGHTNATLPDGGTFTLSGRSYHRIGALRPSEGTPHQFGQIYMLDAADATSRRLEIFVSRNPRDALRPAILSQLHSELLACNPLVSQFRAAALEARPLVWSCADDVSGMQIGALIHAIGNERSIRCLPEGGDVQFIDDGHQLYHPLAYPLLFVTGQNGWYHRMQCWDVTTNDVRAVSLPEWARFKLMLRQERTHLQSMGKLTLELWADIWAQHEARSASFHRRSCQQAKYRNAPVAAIVDQLSRDSHPESLREVGQPVITILPSSFVGSARFYHALYMDAMQLPTRYGRPDLFITFTCNPKWREITDAMPAGDVWQNHPDIVARVFRLKLKALLHDIRRRQIFGPVDAFVYRIEWQKRGLPHMHMLLILHNKLLSPSRIDEVVCAEIPCPVNEPDLHRAVVDYNIHTPCDNSPGERCRQHPETGAAIECYRHFPKDIVAATCIVSTGFPLYRRRGRHVAHVRDRMVGDNWVVPYNRYLTVRYQAHINCEVAAHIKSFKYVYKYVFKPGDFAAVSINEIDAHLNGRLLTVSEAVWRILEFSLHKEWPPVQRLSIHLPECQVMVFNPEDDVTGIQDAAAATSSTLLQWFELNRWNATARQYTYNEIPEHFVWQHNVWLPRVRNTTCIGRIYSVSVHNLELYALRRLLSVVRGAQSWEDMYHFNGVVHDSFRAACYARGMLEDGAEVISAFTEAAATITSLPALHHVFVDLILNCAPADPAGLFNMFADELRAFGGPHAITAAEALSAIERIMVQRGHSVADFGMEVEYEPPEILPVHDMAACQRLRDQLLTELSNEQMQVYNEVMASQGGVYTLMASAGCGKSKVANAVAAAIRSNGGIAVCVASSALAASNLKGGGTGHSVFKIPIPATDTTFCAWGVRERTLMRAAQILIWDEISMVHCDVCDTVERSLRNLMQDDRPFGNKVVVLMGDWKQLLPVVRMGHGEDFTVHRCQWWPSCHHLQLQHNWRAGLNAPFAQELLSIGNGAAAHVPVTSRVSNLTAMIDRVYGSCITAVSNRRNLILSLTLEDAREVNNAVMDLIPAVSVIHTSADVYQDCRDIDAYPLEYVQSLQMHGAPPAQLRLIVGARYMIIRNLNVLQGVCNGIMCVLLAVTDHFAEVQLISGPQEHRVVLLPRCVFSISPEASGLPFTLLRRQLPLIPAYCLSVHKSQGQTLDKVGLYFTSDPFTHGQLYTALSRTNGWDSITVLLASDRDTILNMVRVHILH